MDLFSRIIILSYFLVFFNIPYHLKCLFFKPAKHSCRYFQVADCANTKIYSRMAITTLRFDISCTILSSVSFPDICLLWVSPTISLFTNLVRFCNSSATAYIFTTYNITLHHFPFFKTLAAVSLICGSEGLCVVCHLCHFSHTNPQQPSKTVQHILSSINNTKNC